MQGACCATVCLSDCSCWSPATFTPNQLLTTNTTIPLMSLDLRDVLPPVTLSPGRPSVWRNTPATRARDDPKDPRRLVDNSDHQRHLPKYTNSSNRRETTNISQMRLAFLRHMTGIPDPIFRYGLDYFKAIVKKTQLHSHLWFLTTCVRHGVVPQNLRFDFVPLTANNAAYKGCLNNNANRLLHLTIRELRKEIDDWNNPLLVAKNAIRALSMPALSTIKRTVTQLNANLFSSLRAEKTRKLRGLGVIAAASRSLGNQPGCSSVENPTKVVTIPDDLHLDTWERKVLSRGLSFVPSNGKFDIYELHRDYQQFARRLRLQYLFHGSESRERSEFDLINPKRSNWTPPEGNNPSIDCFIHQGEALLPLQSTSNPLNLKCEEICALKSLRSRSDIVIKPADKGGAVVVWRKDLYLQEGMRQLLNPLHYVPMNGDPTVQYQSTVVSTIENLCDTGELPEEAKRLVVETSRCSRFYLLPKIHKQGNPGRPIVSACSCPTMHISAYVDSILQPIVRRTPAFLKDTTDFLLAIKDITLSPDSCFMATGDVASLYTVIPHQDGLRALRYFLDKRSDQTPSTETVLRLAELVLTLNAFEFDGQHYQQVSGVAMGTKMGPSYADLFMAWLEVDLFLGTPLSPHIYRRFRDDIFILTRHTQDQIMPFLESMNSMHPNIKIEFQIGNELSFLDTLVKVSTNNLQTSIYYKPTDSHSYLLYTSNHPRSTKDAIPYSQFLRLRRICSDDQDFRAQCATMRQFMLGKLYPETVVDRALQKVQTITRDQALTQSVKQNNKILPFVTTYGTTTKQTIHRVKALYETVIMGDETLKEILPSKPLAAFRRHKNLRDLLVKASVTSAEPRQRVEHPQPGTIRCDAPRCLTCAHTILKARITGPRGSHAIKDQFNCKSNCVIYAITCTQCDAIYIGQTKRRLHERFREHLYGLSKEPQTAVGEHFTKLHSRDHMRITAIQAAPADLNRRLEAEARIIFKLGTHQGHGLNTDFKLQ